MIGAMVVALALDAAFGWPDALYRRIGHPVTWIGGLIGALDRRLNAPGDPEAARRAGKVTVALVLGATLLPALALQAALNDGLFAALLAGILAWPLVAARSLHDHVSAVAEPLGSGDTEGARHAVSMIVGRDPATLDPPAIARAGIESLAENASDAVVAPLVWGALLGLPGIVAYKAINTMDSMIGHRTPRHVDFGRAAAILDDWANWVPARLTGALFCVVSPSPRAAFAAMCRDAPGHRSPNAGWPEGAMAAALDCRLSGPRVYAEGTADEPWLNEGAPDPGPDTMERALSLYRRAMLIFGAGLLVLWLV
ncbi:Cobalamin biosynthesis protein CobD [Palleronia abyssalis]|uniref:Cobalamin biosynthesis protein CobD n=2 Tax=Palleronia abyssalis TaxID=1501240 RepID=A0A2R8BTD1_9RHOB|nr:Cobalamin biosynthesis protein CobD [Palleronia abyssalis]